MAHILLVEDDAALRQSLKKTLVREGHEVVEAADERTALNLFDRQPADLVLLDVYLPDADGVETIARLIRAFPDVRVVAMSGGGFVSKQTTLDLARRLGARRTLSKPFSRQELLEVVREVLGQGG